MNVDSLQALIVQEEVKLPEVMKKVFVQEGYKVKVNHLGQPALDWALVNLVDVAVVDIYLPGISGLDVATMLTGMHPEISIVFVAGAMDFQLALDLMARGALYCLVPPISEEAIRGAAKRAARVQNKRHSIVDAITPREREVIRLLAFGKTDNEIAQTLYIETTTVNSHVRSLLSKLEFNNRTQLALLWNQYIENRLGEELQHINSFADRSCDDLCTQNDKGG